MRKKGFTLIELLIVVAIIAILAAIAVPNFLEAQVRSKVSRIKSDHRSLATAIESYYVDTNAYPSVDSSLASTTSGFGVNHRSKIPSIAGQRMETMPTFRGKKDTSDLLQTLTTPIAYISSYFPDPFAKSRGATSVYSTPDRSAGIEAELSGWILWSFGPDNDEQQGGNIGLTNPGVELSRVDVTFYNPMTRVPSDSLIDATYDPTNGTTSRGDVYRVKQ